MSGSPWGSAPTSGESDMLGGDLDDEGERSEGTSFNDGDARAAAAVGLSEVAR
jgi:hypothetical protein